MNALKNITVIAAIPLILSSGLKAQAVVGDVAPDQVYSEFAAGGAFTVNNVRANTGQVVVLYYYTPW